jgi:predicted DNA-binding transcriptional regulator YafY
MSGTQKLKDTQVLERALDIIQRLQAGQRLSAQRIADLYGINVRSAYRLIVSVELALPVTKISRRGQQSYLKWAGETRL